MLKVDPRDKAKLIDPLFAPPGPRYWLAALALLAVIGWGVFMYLRQFIFGLGETGMNRPLYWGVYMVNFIFFIGISHAGTLISAILRVTGAEWRRPITRVAEAITAFALIVGTLQIIIDMGRPDRLLFVILHGRLQSPILWDVVSVTTYFLGSVTYLYLPLIPDAAILRDNAPGAAPGWQRQLYRLLALGWRGNREQWARLEKAIAVMAVFIIPVAVSVHTIISWILATTVQPGWHSSIFGPYFVVGAIFSGIGALFIAMTAVRKVLGLEQYIAARQYRNLGLLFVTMNAIWAYFTYAEHLSIAASQQVEEFPVLAAKLWGEFAPGFWVMVALMAAAFWVLAVPRLLPAAAERVPVSQRGPRFALASAGAAAITLFLLASPQPTPVGQRSLERFSLPHAGLGAADPVSRWRRAGPQPVAQDAAGDRLGDRGGGRGRGHVAGALEHHRANDDSPTPDLVHGLPPHAHRDFANGSLARLVRPDVPRLLQTLPRGFHLGGGRGAGDRRGEVEDRHSRTDAIRNPVAAPAAIQAVGGGPCAR